MRLKLKGDKDLAKKLKKLSDVSGIKHVVSQNGLELQRHAKIIAPVDTGFLKRSITLVIKKNGFQARINSNAEYAGFQERLGTPHITPAFNRQKPKFLSDLRRVANGGRK